MSRNSVPSHGSDGTYSSPLEDSGSLAMAGLTVAYRALFVLINMNHWKQRVKASRARSKAGRRSKKKQRRRESSVRKRKEKKRDETKQQFIRPPEPISEPPPVSRHSLMSISRQNTRKALETKYTLHNIQEGKKRKERARKSTRTINTAKVHGRACTVCACPPGQTTTKNALQVTRKTPDSTARVLFALSTPLLYQTRRPIN